MLMFIERSLFRASSKFVRSFSVAVDHTPASQRVDDNAEDFVFENDKDYSHLRSDNIKSLRVAIIGLPNVGKSTLINNLTRRHMCPTAARVHVTRSKADVIYRHEDTQLVFVDTPGLVTDQEFKKFNMEDSFRDDVVKAMSTVDIVGVVQDASNKYTRGTIHDRILELLKMSKLGTPSILILNKVDVMKRKRELLALVHSLTSENGWPNFSDVFMVSALKSDGVNDLRNYLLDSAKLRDWDYPPNAITDQPPEKIVELTIRAKLMDCLPNELPYRMQVQMELFHVCEDGSLNCVAIVLTESDRISKLVLGKGGSRIKIVARQAEQELSNAFRTSVRLKIAVKFRNIQ